MTNRIQPGVRITALDLRLAHRDADPKDFLEEQGGLVPLQLSQISITSCHRFHHILQET